MQRALVNTPGRPCAGRPGSPRMSQKLMPPWWVSGGVGGTGERQFQQARRIGPKDRVTLRCPWHDDKQPSAAVLATGVLTCSAGCPSRSPYSWLVELGREPAAVMELLVELELRSGRRELSSAGAAGSRRAVRRPQALRAGGPNPSMAVAAVARPELPGALLDRLAAAELTRRRYDGRLAELRGFAPEILDLAGVGVGRAVAFGFRGPRAALAELRLLLPVHDERHRPVGLLAIAPNPERRHEPKVLARPGTPRLPLELAAITDPIAPLLLIAEGEGDSATAASAGIPAVGVPGLGGFERHAERVAELVRELGLEYAVLIPDGDAAGRSSFRALAQAIAAAGAPATLADVLPDGADVGSELVRLAGELELEHPELSQGERRRAAGLRLLELAGVIT